MSALSSVGRTFQLNSYLRGTLVPSSVTFSSLVGVVTDPTTISAVVYPPGLSPVTYVYPTMITRTGAGIYVLLVDTTPATGEWVVHWSGVGAVQAVWDDVFMVYQNRP